jgi:hypothetical protein
MREELRETKLVLRAVVCVGCIDFLDGGWWIFGGRWLWFGIDTSVGGVHELADASLPSSGQAEGGPNGRAESKRKPAP